MNTNTGKFTGWSFELDEYGRIYDLIPVKKEFKLEDVIMLDTSLYIISPRHALSMVIVNREEAKETLWVNKETAQTIKSFMWSPNPNKGANIKNIESILTFMHMEYASGKPFIIQRTPAGKKKTYWDELSELDARAYIKHCSDARIR